MRSPGWKTWLVLAVLAWCYLLGPRHTHFFFLNWLPDEGKGLWDARAVRLAVFALGLAGAFFGLARWRPRAVPALVAGLLLLGVLSAFQAFRKESRGLQPLGRDDHASFQHRIWAMESVAPSAFTYDPFWNGGRVTNSIAASGAWAPGIWMCLASGFGRADLRHVYSPVIAAYFLLVVPWLAFLSLRLAGASRLAGLVAAVLALGTHFDLFKHLLHFGTLGFSFAVPLLLPLAGLLVRILARVGTPAGWRHWLALGGAVAFSLAWPVHGVILALLAPGALRLFPWRDRRAWLRAGVVSGLLACWFVPLAVGLYRLTEIGKFVRKGIIDEKPPHTLAAGAGQLLDALLTMNPLLLFAGLGGLALLSRDARRLLMPVAVGVPLAIFAGPFFSPSLEWHRLVIGLAMVLVLPASMLAAALIDPAAEGPRAPVRTLAAGTALALLLLTVQTAARFWGGRSPAPFHPVKPEVNALADWVRANLGPGQRLLFAGDCGHAFGGGHTAIYPRLSGREMMAADYYHFSPKMVEYFMPPRAYRGEDRDVYDYMRLFNVHAVAVWRREIGHYYDSHPEWYEHVAVIDSPIPKHIYRVKHDGTLFLENSGRVEASFDRLRVTPDNPAADAVIRYNWSPMLRVEGPGAIEPHRVDEHTTFIRVKPGGAASVTIRFAGVLARAAE